MTDSAERFEVFNLRKTIGVSALHGGAVNGVYLHEDVRKLTERALCQEILAVAEVAAMRGRLSLRERIERAAADAGTPVPAGTFEVLDDVPTAEEYQRFARETLKF